MLGMGAVVFLVLFFSSRTASDALPGFQSLTWDPARFGTTRITQAGAARKLSDYRGRVLVVFFGYVRCPDVCPTRLLEIAHTLRRLGSLRQRVEVVFISLDPERDTPELLGSYVAAFDPSFVALSGPPAEVDRIARAFNASYRTVPLGTGYTVTHTAAVYLVDVDSRRTFVAGSELSPTQLLDSLKVLLTAR